MQPDNCKNSAIFSREIITTVLSAQEPGPICQFYLLTEGSLAPWEGWLLSDRALVSHTDGPNPWHPQKRLGKIPCLKPWRATASHCVDKAELDGLYVAVSYVYCQQLGHIFLGEIGSTVWELACEAIAPFCPLCSTIHPKWCAQHFASSENLSQGTGLFSFHLTHPEDKQAVLNYSTQLKLKRSHCCKWHGVHAGVDPQGLLVLPGGPNPFTITQRNRNLILALLHGAIQLLQLCYVGSGVAPLGELGPQQLPKSTDSWCLHW